MKTEWHDFIDSKAGDYCWSHKSRIASDRTLAAAAMEAHFKICKEVCDKGSEWWMRLEERLSFNTCTPYYRVRYDGEFVVLEGHDEGGETWKQIT